MINDPRPQVMLLWVRVSWRGKPHLVQALNPFAKTSSSTTLLPYFQLLEDWDQFSILENFFLFRNIRHIWYYKWKIQCNVTIIRFHFYANCTSYMIIMMNTVTFEREREREKGWILILIEHKQIAYFCIHQSLDTCH